MYEPEEGYYFGDSGGKDSEVLKHLLIRAGVKFDAIHNVTGLGKPEQINHIKNHHPETKFDFPEKKIRQLIIENAYPPTRIARYCCAELKEHGGEARFKVMGIRAKESHGRQKNRKEIEICYKNQTKLLNPLYYWSENDIWHYISENNLKYCKLYDMGYNRVGCIFCPMKPNRIRQKEAKDYPKFKERMIRIFDDMIVERKRKGLDEKRKEKGKFVWKDGEEVFRWWLNG